MKKPNWHVQQGLKFGPTDFVSPELAAHNRAQRRLDPEPYKRRFAAALGLETADISAILANVYDHATVRLEDGLNLEFFPGEMGWIHYDYCNIFLTGNGATVLGNVPADGWPMILRLAYCWGFPIEELEAESGHTLTGHQKLEYAAVMRDAGFPIDAKEFCLSQAEVCRSKTRFSNSTKAFRYGSVEPAVSPTGARFPKGRKVKDSPMRHLILVSGKDSLATALFQTTHEPRDDYEFLFNDTGCELPETYQWLSQVEEKTGWQITRIGRDLMAKIRHRNGFLPSSRARYCTRETKIDPTHEYLKKSPATVYYGIRADENRVGHVPLAGSQITPRFPLAENGIGLRGVMAICEAQGLMPPAFFWPRLFEAVDRECKNRIGLENWQDWISKIEHRILFAGRSRNNCYFCFFQRQYEWVWLSETHPDLFQTSASLEKVNSDFTWNSDYSLGDLLARKDEIFARRVRDVVKYIEQKRFNPIPLESEEISAFSCGLLCGK